MPSSSSRHNACAVAQQEHWQEVGQPFVRLLRLLAEPEEADRPPASAPRSRERALRLAAVSRPRLHRCVLAGDAPGSGSCLAAGFESLASAALIGGVRVGFVARS